MEDNHLYDAWRKRRASVEVPPDFTERVMTSIHSTRRRAWWLLLHRIAAAAVRSRLLRAVACSLALAVWMARMGIILAIFVPR